MMDLTATDFFYTLNGFDEIAIKNAFGRSIDSLGADDKMTFARALVFVAKRREGMNDVEAKAAALGLPIKDVHGFWAAEPDDVMPEEPDSDLGKDE